MTRVLFVLIMSIGALGAAPGEVSWLWPVTLDPGVSSNFCQYRDGRFHAGLDVRTFGREGIPCVAVADGWVSRVRASSRGYGRALHLTLESGTQVVYAHLAEFAPALEETLRAQQERDTSYAVDFRPPAGRFRVLRGDTIAYSGSTGATAPHLHLEIRDSLDAPVNPLLNGLPVADHARPRITRVVLIPLEAGAAVNGSTAPWEAKARRLRDGVYGLGAAVRVRGAVGVAVAVADRANAESGSLAPYDLQLWSDDSLAARVTFGRFTFDRAPEVDLTYQAGAMRSRGEVLYQLFAPAGVQGGVGEFVRGGMIQGAPGGDHAARIIAADASNNRCELAFTYRYDEGGSVERDRGSRSRPLGSDLDGAFFGGDFAVIPLTPARRGGRGGGDPGPTAVVRVDDAPGIARPLSAFTGRDTATVYVAGLRSDLAERIEIPSLRFSLEAPAGSLFGDEVVYVRGVDGRRRAPSELEARSRPVRVGPVGWVLKQGVTVRIGVDELTDRDAMYRGDESGAWSFLATERDSIGVVSASSNRPGVFAVFRDQTAPRLGTPRVRRAVSYATGAETPEIQIPVDDGGSGFDEARTRVWVGGRRRAMRWDFMAKKVVVSLDDETIIGSQPIRVVAFDRIGNSAHLDATIDIDAR